MKNLLKSAGYFSALVKSAQTPPSFSPGNSYDKVSRPGEEPIAGKIDAPKSSAQPPSAQPSSIPSATQNQLTQLLQLKDEAITLKPDGILGDKTKAAIQKFKELYNVPANVKDLSYLINRIGNEYYKAKGSWEAASASAADLSGVDAHKEVVGPTQNQFTPLPASPKLTQVQTAKRFRDLVKSAQNTPPNPADWYDKGVESRTLNAPSLTKGPAKNRAKFPEKFDNRVPAKAKPSDITLPETTIVGKAPDMQFSQTLKDIQQKLSRLNAEKGIGIPLRRIDGLMGPDTRQALDTFKKQFLPAQEGLPAVTDKQIFARINSLYSEVYPQEHPAAADLSGQQEKVDENAKVGPIQQPFTPLPASPKL